MAILADLLWIVNAIEKLRYEVARHFSELRAIFIWRVPALGWNQDEYGWDGIF
jgi:hypothetical protein